MEVPSLVEEGTPEKKKGEKLINEENKAPHSGGGGGSGGRAAAAIAAKSKIHISWTDHVHFNFLLLLLLSSSCLNTCTTENGILALR
jgi:hypothetical protein